MTSPPVPPSGTSNGASRAYSTAALARKTWDCDTRQKRLRCNVGPHEAALKRAGAFTGRKLARVKFRFLRIACCEVWASPNKLPRYLMDGLINATQYSSNE